MICEKTKKSIDDMTYEQMPSRWRFAPVGDPTPQGEVGEYFKKRIQELEVGYMEMFSKPVDAGMVEDPGSCGHGWSVECPYCEIQSLRKEIDSMKGGKASHHDKNCVVSVSSSEDFYHFHIGNDKTSILQLPKTIGSLRVQIAIGINAAYHCGLVDGHRLEKEKIRDFVDQYVRRD